MKHLKEWTQTEFLVQQAELEEQGIKVYLIDTVLNAIPGTDTYVYNPIELQKAPKGSYFVFYCDTGKTTMDRLDEYAAKFPDQHCISLKGGRGYWRHNLRTDMIHCLLSQKPEQH